MGPHRKLIGPQNTGVARTRSARYWICCYSGDWTSYVVEKKYMSIIPAARKNPVLLDWTRGACGQPHRSGTGIGRDHDFFGCRMVPGVSGLIPKIRFNLARTPVILYFTENKNSISKKFRAKNIWKIQRLFLNIYTVNAVIVDFRSRFRS